MIVVKPFRGTRYNNQLIEDMRLVVAPPYDVISPEQQEMYYQTHPFNVIRLILGKETPADDEYNNKYTRALSYLKSWKRDGILVDDMQRSIYFYEQEFMAPDGKIYARRGFFALVKLHEYNTKKIFAHEHTRSKPKADRLQLLRTTKSNLSPIFVVYPDKQKQIESVYQEVMQAKPWLKIVDQDGITHRLWVVNKKGLIEKIKTLMSDKQLIIADGHHRYETALNYQREMQEVTGKRDGEQPFDYIMMFLTSLDSEGLVILPTHRILHKEFGADVNIVEVIEELSEYFDTKEAKVKLNEPEQTAKKITSTLAELGAKRLSYAMLLPGNRIIYLSLKPRIKIDELIEDDMSKELKELDVVVLHRFIISQIWIGNPEVDIEDDELIYTHDIHKVISQIRSKDACASFILNPPSMEKIKKLVLNGELMPPKTTYFYPKLLSGLVVRDMSLG